MNKILKDIKKFEKNMNWSKTSKKQILKFLKKDVKELEKNGGKNMNII